MSVFMGLWKNFEIRAGGCITLYSKYYQIVYFKMLIVYHVYFTSIKKTLCANNRACFLKYISGINF